MRARACVGGMVGAGQRDAKAYWLAQIRDDSPAAGGLHAPLLLLLRLQLLVCRERVSEGAMRGRGCAIGEAALAAARSPARLDGRLRNE